ncbi:microsomal triglyceride transfer protein-like [Pristis pectinata]|uniref:microsomal triglyceride transfer protein-like n=1 Tax=Pristis pectinata TaxID=685728 RepID=UPI00223DD2CB|nr:microsomal triglyceride transfer protein-like [Pristis pectinata]
MGNPDISRKCMLMLVILMLRCAEGKTVDLESNALFKYKYIVDLSLETLFRPATLPGSGFRIEAVTQLHVVWENSSSQHDKLIQLQIQEVKLLNVSKQNENQNNFKNMHVENLLGPTIMVALKKPVVFHWRSGKIEALYGSAEERGFLLNLKRGLVSLFQLQQNSGTITEVDVSGNCRVTYLTENNQVTKIKDLLSCERPEFGFNASNQVFGVQWQPTCKGLYSVENGVIKTAVIEEGHVFKLNLQTKIGAKISSRQQLHYLTSELRPKALYGKSLQETLQNLGIFTPFSLTGVLEKIPCKNCTFANGYLKSLNEKDSLQDVSKVSAAKVFLAFVHLLREAKKIEILNFLKKAADNEISFLIDSATAAQTESSLSALSEYLDFTTEKHISQVQTFLYAAALSSRPSKELLNTLLAKLRGKIASREVQETTILVIGAVIGKMCLRNLCKLQEVEVAKKVILDGLTAAKEESDVKMYLLALKNALLPETIPLLLQYTKRQTNSVTSIVVAALQRFPSVYITHEVKKQMIRIFHQSRSQYGTAVRMAALDVILNNQLSSMELKNIVLSVGEMEPELSKYTVAKLQNILHSSHHPASKVIREVLKDPMINNYNCLSRIGSSSSSSGYLAVTTDTISTYNMDLLFGDTGILQKSHTDFFIFTQGGQLHATQVSIEAKGLDSFFKESSTQDDDEIMAGMSVILFDVQFPPAVFFQGYSDLMEKLWSVTEEPTSIIKGSILLIDYQQAFLLQSGLLANAEFEGGLGIDVSGNIELSLWSQKCKTNIRSRGALVINSIIRVDTTFVQVGVESNSEATVSLDFVSSVKFIDSPILICLQLLNGPFKYREKVVIYKSFQEHVVFIKRKKRTWTVQGAELPLHRANSEMCKKLF